MKLSFFLHLDRHTHTHTHTSQNLYILAKRTVIIACTIVSIHKIAAIHHV